MNKWLFFIFSFVLIIAAEALLEGFWHIDFNTYMLIAILGQLLRHDIFNS
ncbi:MAG: hypothetical protein RBT15_04660 [Gudongella sp.]|jgi:hypothetical protein|nr:hypothetical protein [Gudongella sp.]